MEVGFDNQGKRRKVIFPVPERFILLPPSSDSSKPSDIEPAPGAEDDELEMADFYDIDLVEVRNKLLSAAGAIGSSSQGQADEQA